MPRGARVACSTSNRNRSIEAHLANHGLDMFYGQGDPTDDPKGAEHARDTRLRLLRVDRLDGTPLAGWIHFPVHLTTSAPDVDIWDTDLAGTAHRITSRARLQRRASPPSIQTARWATRCRASTRTTEPR